MNPQGTAVSHQQSSATLTPSKRREKPNVTRLCKAQDKYAGEKESASCHTERMRNILSGSR